MRTSTLNKSGIIGSYLHLFWRFAYQFVFLFYFPMILHLIQYIEEHSVIQYLVLFELFRDFLLIPFHSDAASVFDTTYLSLFGRSHRKAKYAQRRRDIVARKFICLLLIFSTSSVGFFAYTHEYK